MLCAALAAAAPQSLAAAEPPTSGSAVIIGNRDQEAPYAHRDATAFERFVLDVHRFDPDRIALLRDASEAEITLAFQTAVHREAPVMLVYFSGRAVRGTGGGRGPVRLLLDNIAKANARSVWVFLDTSSASKADRGLLRSFPQGPDRELTALVAASPNETASSDEGTRQGLFTRHLLDALYGWADDDGDGHVTAREAKAYLDDTMTPHARRELGTTQTASLMGTRDAVLATERAVPAFDPPPAPATPGGARTAASRAPDPTAVEVEVALSLSRGERRLIQRGLAAARFDVGPLDGIFGPRTRAAIVRWQTARAQPPTGYLDAEGAEALLAAGRMAILPEPSVPW